MDAKQRELIEEAKFYLEKMKEVNAYARTLTNLDDITIEMVRNALKEDQVQGAIRRMEMGSRFKEMPMVCQKSFEECRLDWGEMYSNRKKQPY